MIFSIIIFIFTLLTLVVVHEFGHFLMAKKFGIKVLEFGFGIPPKIWGKKIGETLYSLNALPLGGFVRLMGEGDDGKAISERDFRAKPVGKRIIVVVAGVTMNLLLAWIIFYLVIFYQNFKIIYPTIEPAVFIGALQQSFPAQNAGVKIGDKLLKIDGKDIKNFDDARKFIQEKNGAPVNLTLADIDGNNTKVINITPKKGESGYLIGVVFSPFAIKTYNSPTEKIFSGISYSLDLTRYTYLGLGKTISDLISGNYGKVSQSVAGPVGLAQMSNGILSEGVKSAPTYLWFVGIISLTLAIFNVLPIPALDGGRLLFLAVEAIFKKKVREDIEKWVHQIGFAILLTLALLITYSDISKLIH